MSLRRKATMGLALVATVVLAGCPTKQIKARAGAASQTGHGAAATTSRPGSASGS